jgi:hypothetical protein
MMLAVVALGAFLSSALASFCNQEGYSVVFEDDFEGTMLNTTRYRESKHTSNLLILVAVGQLLWALMEVKGAMLTY